MTSRINIAPGQQILIDQMQSESVGRLSADAPVGGVGGHAVCGGTGCSNDQSTGGRQALPYAVVHAFGDDSAWKGFKVGASCIPQPEQLSFPQCMEAGELAVGV